MAQFTIEKQPGGRAEGGMTQLQFTFEVGPGECEECDGLQVIQVVWATPHNGSYDGLAKIMFGGLLFGAFVDGGVNSPQAARAGGKPTHPAAPYYNGPDAMQMDREEFGKCGVRFKDFPLGVINHAYLFLEVAVVCINHKGSGIDKVLKAVKWGFNDKGRHYLTSPGTGARRDGVEEYSDVSADFKHVLSVDYPNYVLQ